MRVYKPKKGVALLNDALRELYLLRQAIAFEHPQKKHNNMVRMTDKVRDHIKGALDMIEKEESS